MTAPLRIAVVYPDLLGTYGDGGNGLVLARRAEWRGLDAVLLQAPSDRPLPEADLYCLGGGEDGPQVRAARTLLHDGTLARRAADGAVVLAVCAGFQIVGRSFPGAAGDPHEGVGLLDVDTVKPSGSRAVGEVLVDVDAAALGPLPPLTGFENHGGATARRRAPPRWARPSSAWGTVLATEVRGPSRAGSSARTSTARCWRATLPSLTGCSLGPSARRRCVRWTTGSPRACARSGWPASGVAVAVAAAADAPRKPPSQGRAVGIDDSKGKDRSRCEQCST